MKLIFSFNLILLIWSVNAFDWPLPYQRLPSRPPNDPYCQAGLVPFCPNGDTIEVLPVMDSKDTIEIFALKKPVWSFKYGPLLGYFHIMHDALGFRNTRTGLNYTMEWYELDQLFNCTFPHVLQNNSLTWCNQGALCVYDGINDTLWTEYGTLNKISEISGSQFNQFANWTVYDNNTAIYYETWTVYNTDKLEDKSLTMYFDSFDCASWVLRSLDQLYLIGARFDTSVKLNYTRLNLYSDEPQLLGNYTDIFLSKNKTLIKDILNFYDDFQKPVDYVEQLEKIYIKLYIERKFYFYFNSLYWYLKLKEPVVKITYDYIPLPGGTDKQIYFN